MPMFFYFLWNKPELEETSKRCALSKGASDVLQVQMEARAH